MDVSCSHWNVVGRRRGCVVMHTRRLNDNHDSCSCQLSFSRCENYAQRLDFALRHRNVEIATFSCLPTINMRILNRAASGSCFLTMTACFILRQNRLLES